MVERIQSLRPAFSMEDQRIQARLLLPFIVSEQIEYSSTGILRPFTGLTYDQITSVKL